MCESSECVIEYIRNAESRDTLRKYPNPLHRELQCGLLNNKKNKYYIHNYMPSPALDELTDLTGVDLTSRKNCCRCVSISLYYTKDIDFKLYMYLANIIRTVGNVKKYKIQPDHYYKCVGEVVDYLSRVKDANFALDEILLLRTFRDLICIDYEKLPDSEFYGGGKKRSAELIRDTAERLAILIDGELEVDPIYDTYSFVYRKRLTISLNPTKGPFNLPNLLCTPEQLQELIAWYDGITSTVEDLGLASDTPSSYGYLFYQMIERLIGPSDNIIELKIMKSGYYAKRYMRTEVSTKQLVNASHITTWCSGIRLYKNSYFAICDHNGLKLMDLVRAKTKQVVGDAYLQKRIQKVSTL